MTIEQSVIQDALGERFRLDRELGQGGMAVVYLAYDQRYDRNVAIKVLRPDLVSSASAERFLREIRVEGRLQHPHILPIYESGSAGQFLYYLMPFVDGETLSDRIAREGPLQVSDALRIARDVADALACAHEQGIIHRDVKPGNILLSGGHAVLADFGVARALAEVAGDKLTSSGLVVGTPMYMSPEQAAADRVDARSDQYSLGCVLYEMLAGEPPFTGRNAVAIFAKHYAETVPSLDVVRPGLDPELIAAVNKTLAKAPADRFADARSLASALDELATTATGPRVDRAPPLSRRALRSLQIGGAVAIILVAWLITSFVLSDRAVLDANKVVVYPLANRAGDDPDGEGVDLLIGMALDHVEPLRWISGWTWLPPDRRPTAGSLTNREYRHISRSLHARYYVTGQILKRPDSISVVLLLHDAKGDSVRQSSASAALGVSSYGGVALQATRLLLPALVDPGREVDLRMISDRKPAAIANWLQGERNYRLSRFADALTFYQRAIDADSLMAFAALKGTQAAIWSHQSEQAEQLLNRALRTRAELPARYQSLLDGFQAYLSGAADTALARLSVALAAAGSWSEASMLMGEVHQHLLPRRVSADSAVAHFQRAALDPGFTPPLIHLAEHAIRQGRIAEAEKLRKRLADNGANPDAMRDLETMSRCVQHGPDDVGFVKLARTDPKLVYEVAVLLASGAQQTSCARTAFEALLTTDAWSTLYSWNAVRGIQGLLLAEGKSAQATSFLTSLMKTGETAENPQLRGAASAVLFLSILNSSAGAPMPELIARTEAIAHERYGARYEQIKGVLVPWLLGNLHADRGDRAVVTFLRDRLAAFAADTANPQAPIARQRADALSARLLLLQGDTAGALAAFDKLVTVAAHNDVQYDLGASLAPERLLFARVYLAQRDYKAAHDVAAAFDHPDPLAFLPFVPASLQIRLTAARALHDASLAEQYNRRLRALRRSDLIAATR